MTTSQRSEDIRAITWRLDAFHSASYFSPQVDSALRDVGLPYASDRYLASRSAPLGAVTGEAVAASFYSFGKDYVCRSLPKVWEIASPERVHAARVAGARNMARAARAGAVGLRNAGTLEQIDEQAAHLNAALAPVIAAMDDTYRPLSAATRRALADAAADASTSADDAVFALWITATHLREYRGDGHGAVLAAAGVTGAQASVLHSLDGGPFPPAAARKVHGWSAEEWHETAARLRSNGLIANGDAGGSGGGGAGRPVDKTPTPGSDTADPDDIAVLTDAGHGLRNQLEEATDKAVAASWAMLDDDTLHSLAESGRLATALAKALQGSGGKPKG